ncbi:MAG: hypothetical protein VKI81_09800 [Synechococcaceae cyanobacterium]|nr:hypothetical protein [Synechococcaceae cyanobacterium]
MNDYQLGAALRQRVLRDRERGLPVDGRRLQAVVGDLCAAEHEQLLPALRHLVMSAAFSSGASQPRPLEDPRLAGRLMQEIAEVFAAPIVERMETVVQGLLELAAPSAYAPTPTPPPPPPLPTPPSQPTPPRAEPEPELEPELEPFPSRRFHEEASSGGLLALLAFLTGALTVALVTLLLWTRQAARSPLPPAPLPEPERPRPPAPPAPRPPRVPELPESPPVAREEEAEERRGQEEPAEPGDSPGTERVDRALAGIQQVYAALSRKDFATARAGFAGGVADQFDPAFFSQFSRVSVSDLEVTGGAGSSVNLRGRVTFVYPDGSTQVESRSFTVDTADEAVVITASEFGRVVKPRE